MHCTPRMGRCVREQEKRIGQNFDARRNVLICGTPENVMKDDVDGLTHKQLSCFIARHDARTQRMPRSTSTAVLGGSIGVSQSSFFSFSSPSPWLGTPNWRTLVPSSMLFFLLSLTEPVLRLDSVNSMPSPSIQARGLLTFTAPCSSSTSITSGRKDES